MVAITPGVIWTSPSIEMYNRPPDWKGMFFLAGAALILTWFTMVYLLTQNYILRGLCR